MRRIAFPLLVLVLLAPLLSSSPVPAEQKGTITLSPSKPSAPLVGSASFQQSPVFNATVARICGGLNACDDFPVKLSGVTDAYKSRDRVRLDMSIDWTGEKAFQLYLYSDDYTYIRSSQTNTDALPGVRKHQHVAVVLPPRVANPSSFHIVVRAVQNEGGYRGRVALVKERPSRLFPPAGFALRNLSLATTDAIASRAFGAGEPGIAIGPKSTILVCAPAATPAAGRTGETDEDLRNGVYLYRSVTGGRTWTYQNVGEPFGGGDCDVVFDQAGGIYLEDLALAPSGVYFAKSTDDGVTFERRPPITLDADREWLATYMPPGGTSDQAVVYTVLHNLSYQQMQLCISRDGGASTVCRPGITDPELLSQSLFNTNPGNVVVERDGDADWVFAKSDQAQNLDPEAAAPLTGPLHDIYFGHYDAATDTVTNYPVYRGPADHWTTGLFPILAIDKAGTLYSVWVESGNDAARVASGPWLLKLSRSIDGGKTWSKALVVNPPKLKNNMLPWITAGDKGKLNIVWVGTPANSSQYDSDAEWFVFLAQTSNGSAPRPTFTFRQITQYPIRYGIVCTLGLFCPSDDSRSLLDFVQVEVDRWCRANVVFGDNAAYVASMNGGNANPALRPQGTATVFALQGSSGMRICRPGTGGSGGSGSFMQRR